MLSEDEGYMSLDGREEAADELNPYSKSKLGAISESSDDGDRFGSGMHGSIL